MVYTGQTVSELNYEDIDIISSTVKDFIEGRKFFILDFMMKERRSRFTATVEMENKK